MRYRRPILWSLLGVGLALVSGWSLATSPESRAGERNGPVAGQPADAPARSASFDSPHRRPGLATLAADAARIRGQLLRVERRLRARTPAGLSGRQLDNRNEALDHLRDYRARGFFPVNTDHPGRRVPYFVDRNGTLCALAYLIWKSGHRNLVAEVAATHNNGTVEELSSNPRLRGWLRDHGLTSGEASMIQPMYDGDRCVTGCLRPAEETVDTGFVIASAIGGGLSVWSGLSNMADLSGDGSRSVAMGIAGGLAGGATTVLGATRFDSEGVSLAIGVADAALGAASTAVGGANLFSAREDDRTGPAREGSEGSSSPALTVSLRPYSVTPRGVRPGVGVGLRF